MPPLSIKPSPKLRSKYRLLTWIVLALNLLWSLPLAFFIGLDATNFTGALTGVLIALALNLLWFLPAIWLVNPYYESLRYEFHEDEIIVRAGIWTHSVKHVPFRTITNIAIKRDIFDRFLFSIGTLEVQTAGFSGNDGGAEESLAGLVDYEGIYGLVAETLRRYRALPMAATQAGSDSLPGDPVMVGALLDELRAIRAILEAQKNGT